MNYGELKASVKSYLYDRQDLAVSIPSFIALAERRIFRVLRVPANEKIVTFSAHDSASVTIPTDLLELKLVTVDGSPVKRISDAKYLANQAIRGVSGVPREFARIGAQLHMFPVPGEPSDISLLYWYDLSGQLSDDANTHEILRIAPDAYLHGALVEASAYLGQDSRIPTWARLYQEEMALIQRQADEAEYAGSVIAVGNAYPDDQISRGGY